MSEFLGQMKRTDYCGEITVAEVGKELTVMGWAAKRRDLGGLIFVDLRDRTGIIQVVFDASVATKESFEKAENVRSEYVLAVRGKLRRRGDDAINPKLPTGEVELVAEEMRVLSDAAVRYRG